MTLIEIMVVIIIIALAAGGISMALGALTRTKLRSGCVKIMAASRFAYNRAISHGNTVRLRLNMEDNTMSLEEAHGHVTLSRVDDPRREGANEQAGEDGAGVDPWAAAQARLNETFQPTFGASPFGPITGRNGETLQKYQTQPIGSGVAVLRMFLPHEPEPREEGIGAIYFFPGGQTEHAVIQLTDRSETVYAVELHPLTGRARLHDWAFEPEDLSDVTDEEDLSEVRDPG
jgi:general secretion pathway protein H